MCKEIEATMKKIFDLRAADGGADGEDMDEPGDEGTEFQGEQDSEDEEEGVHEAYESSEPKAWWEDEEEGGGGEGDRVMRVRGGGEGRGAPVLRVGGGGSRKKVALFMSAHCRATEGCSVRAVYGEKGGAALWCKQHKMNSHIDRLNPR